MEILNLKTHKYWTKREMKIVTYSKIKISYCGLHDKCAAPIKGSLHKMVQMMTQGIDSGESWICFILLADI